MMKRRALALLLSVALAAASPVAAFADDAQDSGSSSTAEAADPCADGHDYEEISVTPATCTEGGSVTYSCKDCGDTYTEETEEALGHDYEEKVTREATEDKEGEVTFTCPRCGDSYTEEIPRLEKKSADEQDEKEDKKDGGKDSSDGKSSKDDGSSSGKKKDESDDKKDSGEASQSGKSDGKDDKKDAADAGKTSSEPASEEEAAETITEPAAANGIEENLPLKFGEIQVTTENCEDILGDGKKLVSFKAETCTLTLKGAEYSYKNEDESSPIDALILYTGDEDGKKDLTIELKDESTLSASAKKGLKSVIRVENGSLSIKGEGSLTISGTDEDASLYAKKNITLFKEEDEPGSLTITARTMGLRAEDTLSISGNTTIEAGYKDGDDDHPGIAVIAGKDIKLAAGLEIVKPSNGEIYRDDDKDLTTIVEKYKSTGAAKVTIQAKKYTISFAGGGAKGSMDPVTVTAKSSGKASYKLPESSFITPQCYAFSRWDISGKKYYPGAEITVSESTQVKATWKKAHTLVKHDKIAPTCTEDGVDEYYSCSVCTKLFGDEAATKEISAPPTLKAIGHKYGEPTYTWASDYSKVTAKRVCEHNKSHVEEETVTTTKDGTEPTCEEDGQYTYTASFKNEAFKTQKKVLTKKAIGHKWEPTWDWNSDYTKASFTLVCKNNSNHNITVSEDNVTVKGVITMPTTSADGKVVRTATTSLGGKQYTDSKELPIDPAGSSGYKWVSSTASAATSSKPSYSWKKKSSNTLNFILKRTEYDAITFSAFKEITVDGKTVSSSNYTTAKGSLKLSLKTSYLNNLSKGSHKLKVHFKDGTAETSFTITDTSSSSSRSSSSRSSTNTTRTTTNSSASANTTTNPTTGDTSNWPLWLALALCSAGALTAIAVIKKRGKQK